MQFQRDSNRSIGNLAPAQTFPIGEGIVNDRHLAVTRASRQILSFEWFDKLQAACDDVLGSDIECGDPINALPEIVLLGRGEIAKQRLHNRSFNGASIDAFCEFMNENPSSTSDLPLPATLLDLSVRSERDATGRRNYLMLDLASDEITQEIRDMRERSESYLGTELRWNPIYLGVKVGRLALGAELSMRDRDSLLVTLPDTLTALPANKLEPLYVPKF
jgi:hypothetical protein